jgi:hypothetical protein
MHHDDAHIMRVLRPICQKRWRSALTFDAFRSTVFGAGPMNVVRVAISLFILMLIGVAATGWIWAGRHQPPAQSIASRVVLTLCILAGIAGLAALWRSRALDR